MGYSTRFEGSIEIFPSLTPEQRIAVNTFCDVRHGGPGDPGIWCDWATDGLQIYWSGEEKSYDMFEWLVLLNEKFFKPWGCELEGQVTAQGQRKEDVWAIQALDGKLSKVKGRLVFEPEREDE
jgi:hypothetical protein